ncbi:MAG: hypothetical protein AB8B82_06200 [Roseovarius sp.]
MTGLLQWSYFIIVPFVTAWVTLFVWGRSEMMSFALIAGTLAGAAMSLGVSALFWNDVDYQQIYEGDQAQ